MRKRWGGCGQARSSTAWVRRRLARAQLDWLIGMNHTRASTLHNGVLCSIGRVQTPTLAMIVKRHHEIAAWVKTFFYEVHADIRTADDGFIARAVTKSGKHDFESKEEAERILADVPEGTPAVVTAVEKKARRTPPPQLHNLGELQKEANPAVRAGRGPHARGGADAL